MRDNYQGGSLGGYIVVAVLLALALIGGLYGLQRYNASRENQENTEVARDESSNENREEDRPRDTPPKETEDKGDTSNETTSDKEDDDTSEESSASSSTDDDEELPQTGPAETVASVVALGALAFAGTSFVRSRSWTSRRD